MLSQLIVIHGVRGDEVVGIIEVEVITIVQEVASNGNDPETEITVTEGESFICL